MRTNLGAPVAIPPAMPFTRLLLAVACLAGCAVTEDEVYELTLHGDSKADEIGGLRVRWEPGDRHDWFAEGNPELDVTVAVRGGTLMLLRADVAELRPLRPDGQANFTPGSTVTIGIEPTGQNIELAFILASGSALEQGQLAPLSCGGTQMFKTLALDFATSEVTVDGTKKLAFSACGITFDPKDQAAFKASSFALLAVPSRTTDGSRFAGVYGYKHVVTVR